MKSSSNPPDAELPWSWHKSLGWRGQFFRLLRWHTRLHATTEVLEAEDVLYTFFQNCYHLRDWLLADAGVSQASLDVLFSKHVELRLAGDICNATKHLVLSRTKQPREFSIARELSPGTGWFGPNRSETFVILSDGIYEVRSLADKCVSIWKLFIQDERLSTVDPSERV